MEDSVVWLWNEVSRECGAVGEGSERGFRGAIYTSEHYSLYSNISYNQDTSGTTCITI